MTLPRKRRASGPVAVVLAAVLGAGCSGTDGDGDDHAGHDHAGHDHSGHDHGGSTDRTAGDGAGGHSGHEGAPGSSDGAMDHSAHTSTPDFASHSGPHHEKHARLMEMGRQLRASGDLYFGIGPLRQLERTDTTGFTTEQLAQYEFQLAFEKFKHGEAAEAESLLTRSFERAPAPLSGYLLGVVQLRAGELENCLNAHSAESCIFPHAGGGVHRYRSGAERAAATLRFTIDRCPPPFRPKVRWFSNIAAMALDEYPQSLHPKIALPAPTLESAHDIGRFPDIGMHLGVNALDLAGSVAIDDFDGDGLQDLFACTAELDGQLRYWKNVGDGSFEDRTIAAGLLGQIGGLNMIHADYDNDGARDVLILRGGWLGTNGRMPNSLLRNRGDGTFEDVTRAAGLDREDYPVQTAAFADYDLDGDLDLFVGNETPPPASGLRFPCQLFRNNGDGTFTDVAEEAGVQTFKLVKGVAWGDWDGDRDPDLFVSSQYSINHFYRNNGDGTFTDIAAEMGVDEPKNSFSTWFWDYDNDGALDLFVSGFGNNMTAFVKSWLRPDAAVSRNVVYRNVDGAFVNRSAEAGVTLEALTMGAGYGDLDNDGWLDFYLGTGAPDFDTLVPNLMYRNDGAGGFQDVTRSGGFGNLQKGHGIAFGDLDNDGDQDVVAQLGGMYPYDEYFNSVFLNPGHGNHWVALDLVGVTSNRDALGARIHVRVTQDGEPRDIYRHVWPRGSFGSSGLRQEIGLGAATSIDWVDVYWPRTDETQRITGILPDRFYRITESDPQAEELRRPAVRLHGAPGRPEARERPGAPGRYSGFAVCSCLLRCWPRSSTRARSPRTSRWMTSRSSVTTRSCTRATPPTFSRRTTGRAWSTRTTRSTGP
ncbi:MAG: CRTAC1 family protein [Gemmatimonadetes bacterium]|nr:CRTAC1 family protein [Gemmatimonadota bacterium]